jgi:trimethylamine:corrinoid methyltransferase-like protein
MSGYKASVGETRMPKKWPSQRKRAPNAKQAQAALRKLQEDAKKKGLDKLTDKQIDDIIDDSRRRMKEKKPMKRTPKSKGPKKRKAP